MWWPSKAYLKYLAEDITEHYACLSHLQYFIHTASSPFLWNSLCHSATFPCCVDDLDIIRGKLNQISQWAGLDDGRVSDKVLLKIHRLHRLCEGNLQGNEEAGGDTALYFRKTQQENEPKERAASSLDNLFHRSASRLMSMKRDWYQKSVINKPWGQITWRY